MRWVPPDSGRKNRIRARMMNEATGMDLMASMAGASSSSTRRNRAERAASTVPAATPRKEARGDPHQGSRRCPPRNPVWGSTPRAGQHPQRRNQDDLLVDRHSAQLPKGKPDEHRPGAYGSRASHENSAAVVECVIGQGTAHRFGVLLK